jgi:hypothetical protein
MAGYDEMSDYAHITHASAENPNRLMKTNLYERLKKIRNGRGLPTSAHIQTDSLYGLLLVPVVSALSAALLPAASSLR